MLPSLAPPRRRLLLSLALLTAAVAAPSCKKDEQDDKRYLRVSLLGGTSASGKAANAASVTVRSGSVLLSSVCVNTATSTPGDVVASLVLSRAVSKDLSARVTVEVASYESLRGSDVNQPGVAFVCDDVLPDPLTAPQSIDIDFCNTESREVVFYLGADCCTNGSAGSGGAAGAGGSSGSSGQSGSAGAGGPGGAGVAGTGTAGQAGAAGGEAGSGGAGAAGEAGQAGSTGGVSGGSGQGGSSGPAGFAQSGGTAASMIVAPHGPGLRVQTVPAACCKAGEVCGAGVTTTGTRCGKNECCNSTVDACVLEPAN